MTEQLDSLKEQLKQKQFKMTTQRQSVLQVFLQNAGQHLSAEDVYRIMKQDDDSIGLATIYRTLELLCSIGMLKKLNFGDGRARYEINDETNAHQHHHLLCVACDNVISVGADMLDEMEKYIEKETGFQVLDHNVTFLGYCKGCQVKQKKKKK